MLVERHQVLRTGYTVVDSEPMQMVRPVEDLKLPVIDVAEGGTGQVPREVRRLIAAERHRPFDLETELMYRVALLRISSDDHVLVRTTHHIAFDKWSAGVANRELGEIYSALVSGRRPDLLPLPFQYADFSTWQRSPDVEAALGDDLAFFVSHVAGVPQVFELPADRPRTVHHASPGATYTETLAGDIVEAVKALARQQGATPFMVMLAAFGVVLGRTTGQDQILVGVPVAGRTRPELEALIGLFINTLVVRLDLREQPSFLELVARVRGASLGAAAHQDLPFDQLVRHASVGRPRGRSPIFQVMFDYINTPGGPLRLTGLDLDPIPVGDDKSAFELTLTVIDDEEGMRMAWEYRTDLFEKSTILTFSRSLQAILRGALAHPDMTVSGLPLMSGSEREEILRAGWGPPVDLATDASPLSLFDSQVAERPQALAVRDGEVEVSYGALAQESTRVARRLRLVGARPGDPVALILGRSWRLVASLLGVMRAGCVAVLLDPDQPPPRLAAMLEQASVSVVLTTEILRPSLPSAAIAVDVEDERHPNSPVDQEDYVRPAPDTPMYVVFTSGSTGRPRGVVVSHRSAANFVTDVVTRYQITSTDRVLQFSSPGFDTMIEEVFGALGGGAALVIRPPELFATFAAFSDFIEEQGITILDLPTAWWSAWVDELVRTGSGVAPTVRIVIVGGEAAATDRWRAWRRIAGDRVRWVNTYGPAEAAVVVATFEPSPRWPGPPGPTVPIGQPIANARLVVIDSSGHELPVGVPGELCVAGLPVGIGYLSGPGGSGSAFSPDPLGPGTMMYRTGDLARLMTDGNFEYRGRIDDQVKIRGTRIEPAEVEYALRQDPQVREAVVTASGEVTDRRLVGHIVPTEASIDLGDLARRLSRYLPPAMIPTSWAVHAALPMTLGGKVDRRTLRDLPPARPDSAPMQESDSLSATESELQSLWSSVLAQPLIGASDDFFSLGGHSLLAVRLLARVADRFGVELPLRTIFDAPTLREMAALIDSRRQGEFIRPHPAT
jgi:amino acid adenylation domain-containing protein